MHCTQPGGCQARGGERGKEREREWRDSRRERGGRE